MVKNDQFQCEKRCEMRREMAKGFVLTTENVDFRPELVVPNRIYGSGVPKPTWISHMTQQIKWENVKRRHIIATSLEEILLNPHIRALWVST